MIVQNKRHDQPADCYNLMIVVVGGEGDDESAKDVSILFRCFYHGWDGDGCR